MKILIVAPDFYPTNGGYANAISNFVKKLSQKNKVETVVYTPIKLGIQKELAIPNVTVERFGLHKIFMASKIWELVSYFKILNIVRKRNIDLIYFETAEFGLLGYLLCHTSNKILVRIHACTETEVVVWGKGFYEQVHSFFIRLFLKKAQWILSTNSFHVEFYKKYFLHDDVYKIAQKNFFVIPNVIDDEKIVEISDGDATLLRKKYLIPPSLNHKIFFTLGRLNSVGLIQKGVEDILRAVYLLKIAGKTSLKNTTFVLVGDGEFHNHIIQLIRRLKLEEYFIVIKTMTHADVQGFIGMASAVLLVSRFEGLSMFALESLAGGAPLLLTQNGGLRDLVVPGENGYLVQSQNVEEITQKLEMLISLSNDQLLLMRQASKALYSTQFSAEVTISKFISVAQLITQIE